MSVNMIYIVNAEINCRKIRNNAREPLKCWHDYQDSYSEGRYKLTCQRPHGLNGSGTCHITQSCSLLRN